MEDKMAAGVFRRAMNYGRDGPLNHEKQHIPSHPGHLMSLAENLASLSLSLGGEFLRSDVRRQSSQAPEISRLISHLTTYLSELNKLSLNQ